MSLNIQKNTSISRSLTANVDGKDVNVATMSGQVAPGRSMTISMAVTDQDLATANRTDIAAALDAFVAEVRTLAAENGLPT